MKLLNLTLPTSAENLAIDEVLLNSLANQSEGLNSTNNDREVLRLWEPTRNMVVIGRSSKVNEEVNREYCAKHDIDVLRRNSGGASIVTGPGCLMYAVVLDLQNRPELRSLDAAHCFVLKHIRSAVNAAGGHVSIQGTSDLTIGDKKFSGNALRITRHGLLYHGTLLNSFDLSLIPKCLNSPPRQPEYRQQRSHGEFLTNMNLDSGNLESSIANEWQANEPLETWPNNATQELAESRYGQTEWTERI